MGHRPGVAMEQLDSWLARKNRHGEVGKNAMALKEKKWNEEPSAGENVV